MLINANRIVVLYRNWINFVLLYYHLFRNCNKKKYFKNFKNLKIESSYHEYLLFNQNIISDSFPCFINVVSTNEFFYSNNGWVTLMKYNNFQIQLIPGMLKKKYLK